VETSNQRRSPLLLPLEAQMPARVVGETNMLSCWKDIASYMGSTVRTGPALGTASWFARTPHPDRGAFRPVAYPHIDTTAGAMYRVDSQKLIELSQSSLLKSLIGRRHSSLTRARPWLLRQYPKSDVLLLFVGGRPGSLSLLPIPGSPRSTRPASKRL
jgi:hypothetical protein